MKVPAGRTDAFLKRPDAAIRAVLVYGPDVGLARERAETAARAVVPDLNDPFQVAELSADFLAAEPGRLIEEAGAISLMGGRRLVRVRDAGDRCTTAFQGLLAADTGDSLIVAEAGDLGPRSSLRKLFESEGAFAAVACYSEGEADISRLIREDVAAAGYRMVPDAVELMAAALGGDRLVVRQEIAKLLTYMGEGRDIAVEDVVACIGDSAATSFDDLVMATADGDVPALDRTLARLYADGEEPVGILRVTQKHFTRLLLATSEVEKGASPDQVVDSMRPPLFFKVKPRVRSQLQRWSSRRVETALGLLMETEADCKRTGLPADTLCHRTLMRIASLARQPSRKSR